MAEFKDSYITEEERKALLIQNLADRPNAMNSYGRAKMSAEDVKKAFDEQFNLVVDRHNALLDITEDVLEDEDTRKESEMLREEAESDRVENEYGNPEYKFDPEKGCVVNGAGEQVLDSDLGGRVGAEMIRQTAEGLRSDAESKRAASESERANAERERAKNEYGDPEYKYDPERDCVVNGAGEKVLDSDLGGRVGAEKKRENTFGTLDKALEEIEETQNRLIEGVFSEQYLTDLDEVNAQLNDIEDLLKDPIAEDNYDESIGGIRKRVADNEKNISKNADAITKNTNAITKNTNAISENNANIVGHERRLESLEIAMGDHYNKIITNTQNLQDIGDFLEYNQGDTGNVFLRCYPVGSIYMSVNPTDPAYLFGGSWVALKDRFLVGAGGSYSVTAEGGEARHTLTLEEMPLHSHIQQATSNYDGWARKQVQAVGSTAGSIQDVTNVATNGTQYSAGNYASPVYTQQNGGGQPHNNIPPYYAVYMWRREA